MRKGIRRALLLALVLALLCIGALAADKASARSEEHTSELQSH